MVYLTEKGKTYTSKTAARLFEAECKALSNWTEEEINLYLKLTERYHADLKNEIESLYKWKNYWNLSNKQRKDLKKIVIKSSIRLWDLTTERKIGKWNRQYSFRIISVTDD